MSARISARRGPGLPAPRTIPADFSALSLRCRHAQLTRADSRRHHSGRQRAGEAAAAAALSGERLGQDAPGVLLTRWARACWLRAAADCDQRSHLNMAAFAGSLTSSASAARQSFAARSCADDGETPRKRPEVSHPRHERRGRGHGARVRQGDLDVAVAASADPLADARFHGPTSWCGSGFRHPRRSRTARCRCCGPWREVFIHRRPQTPLEQAQRLQACRSPRTASRA